MKQLVVLFMVGLLSTTLACNSQKEAAATTNINAQNRAKPRQGNRQSGPPNIEKIFEMDANNDGMLAKSEVKGPLLKDFDKIDTDKNGFLSKEEIEKAPKPQRGNRPTRNK